MSKKTLLILVVVLAGLVGVLWMSKQPVPAPGETTLPEGGPLLPSVDMNTVGAITIADNSATTHLAKVDGLWCVAELDNYPADWTRLREMLRSIDGMEKGPVVDAGADHLAEFGLAPDADPAPTRLVLEHGQGTTVLSLGKMREPQNADRMWGPPPGRYAQVDEGPVFLIKEDIRMAQADSSQWWDRRLLDVPPEEIRNISVVRVDGSYAVERSSDGVFALGDAAEGEEVDLAAANRLFGALRNLRADRMLSGAEASEAAFANPVSYQAQADGVAYRIQMGEAQPDRDGGQPVKIEVAASPDAAPDQQAAWDTAARKFKDRVYLIPVYLADSLRMQRDALVRQPQPAPEPASESIPADEAAGEPAPEEAILEPAPEAVSEPAIEPPPLPEDAEKHN